MVQIIAIGNLAIDEIVEVSHIPSINEAAHIQNQHTEPGGSSTNVAATLQKLGYNTGLITRAGRGDGSERVVNRLKKLGIECERVRRNEKIETAYTHIYTDSSGNQIVLAGGNSLTDFRLNKEDKEYIQECKYIHTSGYTSPHILEEITNIKNQDQFLIFDLATSFKDLASRGYTRELIDNSLIDIDLFVSQSSCLLSYMDSEDIDSAISDLQSNGVDKAAVTLGQKGAILVEENNTVQIPGYEVEVVDTTGAGDAFIGGLIHSWIINQEDIAEAGRFSNATAALNCQKFGGQGGLRTVEEINNFMKSI